MRFLELASDPELVPIGEKVLAGERLDHDDGVRLMTTRDILTVGALADRRRRQVVGDEVYYTNNINMNPTNICVARCKLCAFGLPFGSEGTYTLTHDMVRERARFAAEHGIQEVHIVGGLNPLLDLDHFTTFLDIVREEHPSAYIQGFTAVEIDYLAKREKTDWETILVALRSAGLVALPGGGAEVLNDRIHAEMCDHKTGWREWLQIHGVAHGLGMKTNATILYGHIEDRRERLVHMDMLRRAQDEALTRMGYESAEQGTEARRHEGTEWSEADVRAITLTRPDIPLAHVPAASESDPSSHRASVPSCLCAGSFQAIIPLPFFPDGSALEHLPGPTGLENLRTLAICRLMLDNFPHVKAFWIMQTLGMAQTMLQCGADDIDGTVVWYDITKVGGAGTHQETTVADLKRVIREAGCTPVERDTLYRRVRRDGKRWWIEAQT